ncbi:Tuberous sclerosis 2-like protein [Umbelopsis sp. WA50703]
MEPSAPKEARHVVFEFMAACIDSHYDSLGMARVTFYNALKDHHSYEDLKDMYIVFSKLIKDGRDITNFEKNIIKLLISWLNMAIAHSPAEKLGEKPSSNASYNSHHHLPLATDTTKSEGVQAIIHDPSGKLSIPHLEQIIRLIAAIMKFNFAMFEEKEVTELIIAIKNAFWHSVDTNDQRACLEFADVIVPYGFVPIGGLQAYLDILCRAVAINDSYVSSQQLATLSMSIFKNLLRSHCAHSAVLSLCKSMNQTLAPGSTEELIAIGSLILLTHAAWSPDNRGTNHNNVTSSTVLLSYMRRALKQNNAIINVQIFKSLLSYVQNQTISMTDWDIFWEICREYSETLLLVDDAAGRDIITVVVKSAQLAYVGDASETTTEPLLNASPSNVIQQYFILLHHVKHLYDQQDYKGPLDGFMNILHMLRSYLPEDMALILLDYYDKEHLFLPSFDGWLSLLEETSTTFFISPTSSRAVRLTMLDIIMNVCEATYDMYLNKLVLNVIIPIADMVRTSRDKQVIEKAVGLIVKVASDCTDHDAFRRLISALESCSKCKCLEHPNSSSHGEKSSVQQSINERKRAVSQMARHPPKHYTQGKAPRPTGSISSSTASDSKSKFSTSPSSQASFCLGTASASGLAQIFQHLLHGSDPELCLIVYKCIISIAKSYADNIAVHDTSRLIALDVLLRLRCRPDHRIFLSTSVDATTQYSFAFGDRSLLGTDVDTARTRQSQKHGTPTQDTQPNRNYPIGQSRGSLREPDGLGIDHAINPGDDKDLSWYTERPSRILVSYSASDISEQSKCRVLPATELLHALLEVITKDGNWNTVSFVLEALPAQLSNKHLFCGATQVLQQLRSTICEVITKHSFLENVKNMPPNLKRNDLNIMAYKILTIMISYRRIFSKQKQDEMVFCFYSGIMQITSATRACINALTVCCHELPLSVSKMLNEILLKMSQIISVSSVSVHILEFLSGLARLPNLYANFTGDMYKPVFAIALNYIQYSRSLTNPHQSPTINSPTIHSPSTSNQPNDSNNLVSNTNQPFQSAFAQYLLIMAYQVITVWFIAVPLRERRRHVPFIIKGLLSANSATQTIDEQTLTCIDMLSRFSFANVDLAPKKSIVSNILMTATPSSNSSTHDAISSGKQISRTWVQGNTLFTLKCAATTGWVEATIRRPSGTVSLMCKVENEIRGSDINDLTLPAFLMMHYNPDPGLSLLDAEQAAVDSSSSATPTSATDILESSTHKNDLSVQKTDEPSQSIPPTKESLTNTVRDILTSSTSTQNSGQALSHLRKDEHSFDASFLYLQFGNYPDLAGLRDIIPPVPDDETHQRALNMLDHVAVVNFHKIGVIYVGPGQTHEIDILANQHGSPDYVTFLNGLGTIQQLKGRTGNTGDLDREMDIDGKYAYFWNDDTTEMVFHAATLMPTDLTRDPQCSGKKRHIGNDYVTIVYNDSGKDYAFDTLPGQFNFINIVVSPHSEDSSKVILGSSEDQRVSTSAAANAFAAGQHPDPYTTSTGMDNTFFKVVMQRRPNMSEIGPLTEFKMVSSQTLPGFIRQMALHANVFSQVFLQSGAGGKHEYVSNWCERLRQINRIKERLSAGKIDTATAKSNKDGIMALEPMLDFTRYT